MVGIYLFQGGSVLLPEGIPDAALAQGIPREAVEEFRALCGEREGGAAAVPRLDSFVVPFLEAPEAGDSAIQGIPGIEGLSVDSAFPLPPHWRALPVRQGLSLVSPGKTVDGKGPVGRLLRAYHVAQWRRDSVYCGSCGTKNADAPDELARLCPACGRREYPRISPAVITIIVNDKNEALLAHNRKFADGLYSLIAGFNEAGESLEATVVREIREEVGLEVKEVRYIASQPWPFPNSLMLGFTARHASGEIRPDGEEIMDARWFNAERLPQLPGFGSVSRYLINSWIEGKL
ncbi:MAG: NAD(+) diphosphatase [Treponema sp.]|jgi:NAD+ diphosphatase|nr:NAD(+) diphosphatase [Treponema sp.]